MSKILVTGGAGFIGSHTAVQLFEAGYEPILVDNFNNSSPLALEGIAKIIGKSCTFYEGDCNDEAFMDKVFATEKNIDGVIHFAASKAVGESVQKPLLYYKNNLNSLIVLIETMHKYGVEKLVFSSSCTVYGQPEQLPVTENSPTLPAESPYGNTKQIGEEIIKDVVTSHNIPLRATLLRYFNPIGAHPSAHIGEFPTGVPNNLIPFITQTAAGIRPMLSVFGNDYNTPDGTCIRDYIHVLDLADAHIKALELLDKQREKYFWNVFNIGVGRGFSVLEVIKTFESVTGQALNYKIVPRRSGDVEQVFANVEKATKELGWATKLTLADGLKDAWRWQQKLSQTTVS